MNKMNKKSNHNKAGFTLVELMIALGVFSIIIAGVFTLGSKISLLAYSGTNRMGSVRQATRFQGKFLQQVNASTSSFVVVDSGNKLVLEHFNSGGTTNNPVFEYLPNLNKIVYYPNAANHNNGWDVAEHVHPFNNQPIFATQLNGRVRASFLVNKVNGGGTDSTESVDVRRLSGHVVASPIIVELSALARN